MEIADSDDLRTLTALFGNDTPEADPVVPLPNHVAGEGGNPRLESGADDLRTVARQIFAND